MHIYIWDIYVLHAGGNCHFLSGSMHGPSRLRLVLRYIVSIYLYVIMHPSLGMDGYADRDTQEIDEDRPVTLTQEKRSRYIRERRPRDRHTC